MYWRELKRSGISKEQQDIDKDGPIAWWWTRQVEANDSGARDK